MQKIVRSAMEDGYVSTIYGRRRYILELSSPKFQIWEFGRE